MRVIFTIVLISIQITLYAQQGNSYIQVKAEAGVSVFLDDNFKGKTTSDIGGLIIERVTSGSHIIKVVKEGFNPQEERVDIKTGEVYSYTVKPFIPKIKISQQGNTGQQQIDLQVGKIKIQSLPVAITISIPSLGINSSKTQDKWNADEIPAGSYLVTFSWNNKILRAIIEVKHNQLTHLFVNMIIEKIEDRSPMNNMNSNSTFANQGDTTKNQSFKYELFTDSRDSKIYKNIQIGDQVWMAENMNYEISIGSWVYDNKPYYADTYGRLYNWEAAQTVCPSGWHLPSFDEWNQLIKYLGGSNVAGRKLKETGTLYWKEPNLDATNETGFLAISGGFRDYSGNFNSFGKDGYWWSATELNTNIYRYLNMTFNNSEVSNGGYNKRAGFSVRCVKD